MSAQLQPEQPVFEGVTRIYPLAYLLQKGLDYIRAHPWQTLGNGFRKIANAFSVLPSPRRSFWPSLAYALSYGPVMILGLWGMWAGRRHWRDTRFSMLNSLHLPQSPPCSSGIPVTGLISMFSGSYLRREFWRHG